MRALIFQNHLEPEQINAYHFGFVLGPCINASGRLDAAKTVSVSFLQGEEEAAKTARELVELNQQRKDMTKRWRRGGKTCGGGTLHVG